MSNWNEYYENSAVTCFQDFVELKVNMLRIGVNE